MIRIALIILCAAVLVGCGPQQQINDDSAAMEMDDLRVSITVPAASYRVGDTVPVTITAANIGDDPLDIVSRSGALAIVTVQRNAGLYWQDVKQYPELATQVLVPWTLAPGQSRTFQLDLPVEPDWPTNETIRLRGEINGRPEVAPSMNVRIESRTP